MAGTAVVIGALAVTATLALGYGAVGAAAAHATRLTGVADAAALAAADAASGAIPGGPCERATELAEPAGAALTVCQVDGMVATVQIDAAFGIMGSAARARAGPPP